MLHRAETVSTMSSQVARGLGLRIVSGEFHPGDIIPIETQLCEDYGVSRSTIREAIKNLSSKGLVSVSPKTGTHVLPPTQWNFFDLDVLKWRLFSKLDEETVRDIYEIRLCLQPRAAYLAALSPDPSFVQKLNKNIDSLKANRQKSKLFMDSIVRFYVTIQEGCSNSMMGSLSGMIKASIESLCFLGTLSDAQIDTLLKDYENLCAAIISGRAEDAKDMMTEMIILSRNTAFEMMRARKTETHRPNLHRQNQ